MHRDTMKLGNVSDAITQRQLKAIEAYKISINSDFDRLTSLQQQTDTINESFNNENEPLNGDREFFYNMLDKILSIDPLSLKSSESSSKSQSVYQSNHDTPKQEDMLLNQNTNITNKSSSLKTTS